MCAVHVCRACVLCRAAPCRAVCARARARVRACMYVCARPRAQVPNHEVEDHVDQEREVHDLFSLHAWMDGWELLRLPGL